MQKAFFLTLVLGCAGLGGCVSTGSDGTPAYLALAAEPSTSGTSIIDPSAISPAYASVSSDGLVATQASVPAPPKGMMAVAPLPPRRPPELGGKAPVQLASDDSDPDTGDEADEDEPMSASEAAGTLASAEAGPQIPAANSGSNARNAGPGYYAAYSDTVIACFPEALRTALNTIALHYGKPVEVTSGLRTHGRSGSLHRHCMAADIRIAGVAPSSIETYAKTVPGIHGVGSYHRTDLIHVDVRQEQMAWRY